MSGKDNLPLIWSAPFIQQCHAALSHLHSLPVPPVKIPDSYMLAYWSLQLTSYDAEIKQKLEDVNGRIFGVMENAKHKKEAHQLEVAKWMANPGNPAHNMFIVGHLEKQQKWDLKNIAQIHEKLLRKQNLLMQLEKDMEKTNRDSVLDVMLQHRHCKNGLDKINAE